MEDYKFVGPYITLSIEGLHDSVEPAFKRLQSDLEGAGNTAAKAGAKEGARFAKANHKFKNRSGMLEASIGWKVLVTHGTSPMSEFFADAPTRDGGDSYALYVDKGTKAHPIDPKPGNKTGAMWWNDPYPDGPLRHATHVEHPGSWGTNGPADNFMGRATVAAEAQTQRVLEAEVDAAAARCDRSK